MFRYFSLLVLITFALFLSSCETDFNPNAEYKDITIVYGLLNQSDTITYIKINKAFLGETSAYIMAQDEDFSSYGNNLEVSMEEMVNGSVTDVFYFDTTTVYNKESGVFYAPKQVLYKCHTLNQLNEDREYRLIIKNILTGKIITAETALVEKFNIERPSPNQSIIEFSTIGKVTVKWRSAEGGRRYQVNMRINYFESIDDTLQYESKYIDVNLGTQKAETLESGMLMELESDGLTYYETLKNNLIHNGAPPQKYFRIPGKIEFLISVAGDELSTYIDVNEPSNTIVQVRPEYTNINNGIGIFSARYNNAIDKPRILDLGSKSRDVLKSGSYQMLGF